MDIEKMRHQVQRAVDNELKPSIKVANPFAGVRFELSPESQALVRALTKALSQIKWRGVPPTTIDAWRPRVPTA